MAGLTEIVRPAFLFWPKVTCRKGTRLATLGHPDSPQVTYFQGAHLNV
jgi:hypothetical protein